jgi:hypothetical protein
MYSEIAAAVLREEVEDLRRTINDIATACLKFTNPYAPFDTTDLPTMVANIASYHQEKGRRDAEGAIMDTLRRQVQRSIRDLPAGVDKFALEPVDR